MDCQAFAPARLAQITQNRKAPRPQAAGMACCIMVRWNAGVVGPSAWKSTAIAPLPSLCIGPSHCHVGFLLSLGIPIGKVLQPQRLEKRYEGDTAPEARRISRFPCALDVINAPHGINVHHGSPEVSSAKVSIGGPIGVGIVGVISRHGVW